MDIKAVGISNDPEAKKAYEKVKTCYYDLDPETRERIAEHIKFKDFFMGQEAQHFDFTPAKSDEVRRIVPITTAISLKYQEYLTSLFPDFQAIPWDSSKIARETADRAEKVIYDIMYDNEMPTQFTDAGLEQSMLGTTAFTLNYDSKKNESGRTGINIRQISPLRLRVKFSSNDWRDIEAFITTKRFTLDTIKRIYGIGVKEDNYETNLLGSSLKGWFGATGSDNYWPGSNAEMEGPKSRIPMATVFTYWDWENYIQVIGDYVLTNQKHNYGFTPLFLIRNYTIPNEPWGKPDAYWATDPQISLNYLNSKAEAIIKYQAGPIILDYGNTLKGRQLPAGNNVVVPLPPKEAGSGLEYLEWHGQFYPLLQQMEAVKKLIHDITGMPEAAFGAYQPGTTSGFQLQVQLQPMILRINRKKLEWEKAFRGICQKSLKLIRKFDTQAKKDMPENVENLEFKTIWPDTLPKDDIRVVQNVAIKKKLNLISDYSALEEFGVQSPTDELDMIKQENDQRVKDSQALAQEMGLPQQPTVGAGTASGATTAGGVPGGTTGEILQNTPGPQTPLPGEQRQYPPVPQQQEAAVVKTIKSLGGGR